MRKVRTGVHEDGRALQSAFLSSRRMREPV